MNKELFKELIIQPRTRQRVSKFPGSNFLNIFIKEKGAKDKTLKLLYGDLSELKEDIYKTFLKEYGELFKGKEIQGSFTLPDGTVEWHDLGKV